MREPIWDGMRIEKVSKYGMFLAANSWRKIKKKIQRAISLFDVILSLLRDKGFLGRKNFKSSDLAFLVSLWFVRRVDSEYVGLVKLGLFFL